jgi:hypothetical protein
MIHARKTDQELHGETVAIVRGFTACASGRTAGVAGCRGDHQWGFISNCPKGGKLR